MASEERDLERKHNRSPDDVADEGSKRRKHSRHRSSHRHHHRHKSSKHRHDSKQESEEIYRSNSYFQPEDEDKEEGEILEEEDNNVVGNGKLLKKNVCSDVESGEIQPDDVDIADDSLVNSNMGERDEGVTFSAKTVESIEVNMLCIYDEPRNLAVDETDDGKDIEKINEEVDIQRELTTEKELDKSIGGLESVMGMEKNERRRRHHESSQKDRTSSRNSGDIRRSSRKEDLRKHRGSRSPEKEHDKNYTDFMGAGVSRRHSRSTSPIAKGVVDHRVTYERVTEEKDLVMYGSKRPSELIDTGKNSSENQMKSLSPEVIREKYEIVTQSPSNDKYHSQSRIRNRSRSRDHARDRSSRSRSKLQDMSSYYDEDRDNLVEHLSSSGKARNESDNERTVRKNKENRHGCRDSERDGERERSSSISRQNYDRHGSRDTQYIHGSRDSVMDRERERSISLSRQNGGSRDIRYRHGIQDSVTGRKRKRSSSLSRHNGDRHGGRDKRYRHGSRDTGDREKDMKENQHGSRDRERERSSSLSRQNGGSRDTQYRHGSRDSVGDWERVRSSSLSRHNGDKHGSRDTRYRHASRDTGEREWGGDNDKDRLRDRDRDRDREREKGRSRDMYKDARHQKQEERHQDGTNNGKLKINEDEQEDYEEQVALELAEQEEEDIEKIKEDSRKRREAILQKYKQQQLQKLVEESGKEETGSTIMFDNTIKQPVALEAAPSVVTKAVPSRNDGPDVIPFSVGKSPPKNESSAMMEPGGSGLDDGIPKSERSTEMFYDDIFGESPAGIRKTGKGDGVQVDSSGLNDNWDDSEGYYSYRLGEVLDARYEVIAAHGKGVFSTVVRAKDLKPGVDDPEEVAIKIIRNNDTMYKAGLEELVILKKLVGADPEDRRHCVRFLSSFKYRNHLCLVFESLHMNLREVLKKFGRNIGLKLTAVRAYSKQLFIALKHLRNCGILHCDIKPDNMLVNEAKNVLKLCDFGNAMFAGKNEITPYLVSRFYRAPEIILGLTYDHPMDIWSVGCCLYELYTGKVLFPGPSNNDMLRLHMELKGHFPKKMLRKGVFTDQHFDQDLSFHATEDDPVTKMSVRRLLVNIKPKDIGNIIPSSPGEDPKMLANFKDLLERIFVLDPEKRLTVSQALNHPFITGK
ncbi:hypothetical protein GIB67_025622 [Kingdonia uniflora]|uniref:Serine/threonine-protein kinase PRP4 homolog n=1 Tax=Kingdonia uniflora TaxID=39325 RepID=A0A7J7L8H5_9MAGN|nr:hypothetical protein GIB67_025622 [Kingdonia uniflora]